MACSVDTYTWNQILFALDFKKNERIKMWYLAEPRDVSYLENSIEVFREGRYSVKKQGRHYLIVDNKYLIAEKCSSRITEPEIRKWINAVRIKDIKKVEKTRKMMEEMESACRLIEGFWK